MSTDVKSAAAYGLSDDPGWGDGITEQPQLSAEVAGCRVNYVDLGTGTAAPPLVLIHGIGGCWQHWIQNLPRLAQQRRVIALDLPGFAASPLPRRRISIALYAEVVDALCEQLGLGPVILVGNSLGGMISAETAARYPGRVAKLLLLDAAGISTSNPVYGARIGLQLATLQSVRLIQTLSRVTGARTGHPLRLAVAHPRRLERGLLRAAFLPGSGKPGFGFVVLDAMLTVGNRGSRQRLAAIDVPTLIVWGADDRLLPVGDADVFAELIAGSETVILPDTGHCPMLERPREFNHLLMEFAER